MQQGRFFVLHRFALSKLSIPYLISDCAITNKTMLPNEIDYISLFVTWFTGQ